MHLRLKRRNIIDVIVTTMLVAAVIGLALFGLLRGRNVDAAGACPCTIFGSNSPTFNNYNDNDTQTLGTRFRPDEDGLVVGVRFYKSAPMTATHKGSLWGPTGSRLATGTFQNESATGWQTLIFDTPVAVTAGTTYTTSYSMFGAYIATGAYFTTTPVDTGVLTTLATNQSDDIGWTGNGVYASGDNVYPTNSYNGSNYWADVVFVRQGEIVAPTVNSTTPASNATGVSISQPITVQFNTALNESFINTTNVKLQDDQGSPVASAIAFDQNSTTLTVTPSAPLELGTTYTMTIVGGASGIHSLTGQPLANDVIWQFTTTPTTPCPCSVFDGGAIDNPAYTSSDSPITLGVNIKSDENGFINGLRFYKPITSTVNSHNIAIYSGLGSPIAYGTTVGETGSGWQTALFSSPVAITANQTYRIAYTASDGQFTYSGNVTSDRGDFPIHILHNASYFTHATNSLPNSLADPGYFYWVDPVFTETSQYTPSFDILSAQPSNNSYGVSTSNPITLTPTQAVDAATVAGAITLKTAAGANVAGSTSLDSNTGSLVFTPNSPLASSTAHVLTIASSLKDVFGTNFSSANYSLNFTTGAARNTTLNDGKGGPILVVTSAANKFSTYTAEILRSEGINYFKTADISTINSNLLADYKYVLLGSTSLNSQQTQSLTNWVSNGGNLIAFKPDMQLASLLGITDGGSTLSEGYIKINTASAPGKGIVGDTIQYHTAADRYGLAGATSVATLYSDASTATLNPAVTIRSVGEGYAAAFAYDLPKSITALHQGNSAWANNDPSLIGNNPFRPDSLFHKAGQTDWLNVSKASIPQADEQQRLLVNMLNEMSTSSGPIPHYWHLPHGYKAALVMTSDDHGTSDSTARFLSQVSLQGAPDCSVRDWTCPRAGSLVYTGGGLSTTHATSFEKNSFPLGVHVQTNCETPTIPNLTSAFQTQITAFSNAYPGVSPQQFSRIHCYIWEGFAEVPKVDEQFGIRYTMEYEWFPQSWTGSNTGAITGSYQTMRFADTDGTMIDVYNAPTDLDYENDPTNATINADLASATGSQGFYGIFGTHYDFTNTYQNLLLASAAQYDVPIISADQALAWKDAQSNSTFDIISSSSYQVKFKPQVAEGGEGSVAVLPLLSSNGTLASLKVDGASTPYTNATIKGVDYAVFDAKPGTYVATYGTEPVTPSNPGSNPAPNNSNNPSSGTPAGNSGTTKYASIFSDASSSAVESPENTSSDVPVMSKPTGNGKTNTEMTPQEQKDAANKSKGTELPPAVVIGASAVGAVVIVSAGWWTIGAIRRHNGA